MTMFSRNHPRLCLLVGLFIAGLKWPIDWWIKSQSKSREKAMKDTEFGLLDPDPRMVNAWDRVEGKAMDDNGEPGSLSHNLTNLAIEWTRRWTPYATKFTASFAVYLIIGLLIYAIVRAVI